MPCPVKVPHQGGHPDVETHLPVQCCLEVPHLALPPCRVYFTGICALHSPDGTPPDRDGSSAPGRFYRIGSATPSVLNGAAASPAICNFSDLMCIPRPFLTVFIPLSAMNLTLGSRYLTSQHNSYISPMASLHTVLPCKIPCLQRLPYCPLIGNTAYIYYNWHIFSL